MKIFGESNIAPISTIGLIIRGLILVAIMAAALHLFFVEFPPSQQRHNDNTNAFVAGMVTGHIIHAHRIQHLYH